MNLPHVALGSGFVGAVGNKLATIQQKPAIETSADLPAVSEKKDKKWIQKAVNPEHEGYCTPMTKSTCTPRRKALAKRFKKGGDLHQ